MIKRILVALDPGVDTQVATRYGIDLARSHDAEVTGLTVVDLKSIGKQAQGGGIGSLYFAEQVEARLTAEARTKAEELKAAFSASTRAAGVYAGVLMLEGAPVDEIAGVVNAYDLLVVGKHPHFFYSHPEELTRTLVEVARRTIGPLLVVGDVYRPVERVLVAYDGSLHAGRALHSYAHLQPFGRALPTTVLHVYEDAQDEPDSVVLVQQALVYLRAHGLEAHPASVQGEHPETQILDYVRQHQVDLLVMGAHGVSRIEQLLTGSMTQALLEQSPTLLFMDH
jgi:nucleotide-binding universal stress UspA family protein